MEIYCTARQATDNILLFQGNSGWANALQCHVYISIYMYVCVCVCMGMFVYIYIYIACLVKYVELLQISGRPNKRVYKSTTNLFSSCEMFMFQELQKLPNEISECRCWKTIPFTFLISPDIYLTIVRENAQLYQTIPSPFKSACEE